MKTKKKIKQALKDINNIITDNELILDTVPLEKLDRYWIEEETSKLKGQRTILNWVLSE